MREVFEEWLRENARKSNGDKYSDSSIYKYSSSIDVLNKEFNINLWKFDSIDEFLIIKIIYLIIMILLKKILSEITCIVDQ